MWGLYWNLSGFLKIPQQFIYDPSEKVISSIKNWIDHQSPPLLKGKTEIANWNWSIIFDLISVFYSITSCQNWWRYLIELILIKTLEMIYSAYCYRYYQYMDILVRILIPEIFEFLHVYFYDGGLLIKFFTPSLYRRNYYWNG